MAKKLFANSYFVLTVFFGLSGVCLAGTAVPAPVAGVAGPFGLAAVVLGYGGYRMFKFWRNR